MEMTQTRFRLFIVLYGISLIVGLAASFMPGGYSHALAVAYKSEPEPLVYRQAWLAFVIMVPLAIAGIAGCIGMFFFKSWARRISLATTLVALLLIFFFGPTLLNAVANAFLETSSLLRGAILALAYFSPINARFTGSASRASPRGA